MEMRTPSLVMQAVERLAARDATLFADPAVAADRLGWIGLPAHAAADAPALAEVAAEFVAQPASPTSSCSAWAAARSRRSCSRAPSGAPPGIRRCTCSTRRRRPKSTRLMDRLRPCDHARARIEQVGHDDRAALADGGVPRLDGARARRRERTGTSSRSPTSARRWRRWRSSAASRAFCTPPATSAGATPRSRRSRRCRRRSIGIDVPELAAFGEAAEKACIALGADNPGAALAAWMADAYRDGRDKLTHRLLASARVVRPVGRAARRRVDRQVGRRHPAGARAAARACHRRTAPTA